MNGQYFVGETLSIEVNYDSGLFVGMTVYNDTGNSPVQIGGVTPMVNIVDTLYRAKFTPSAIGSYIIRKVVYTDGSYTTPDPTFARGSESLDIIEDGRFFYKPNLTAAVNPVNDVMEIITWLTRNDALVTNASSCTVDVVDGDNNLIFSVGPDTMIEADGVFKFTESNASGQLKQNMTYTCIVNIVANSVTYTGIVPINVF